MKKNQEIMSLMDEEYKNSLKEYREILNKCADYTKSCTENEKIIKKV